MRNSIYSLFIIVMIISIASCGAQASNTRVMVIGRTDCVPCLEMKSLVDEINAELEDNIASFVNIEIDDSVIGKFDISTLPTTIFFDKNSNEHYRQVKAMSKGEFISHMNKEFQHE